ncbi:hypothetical protein PVBG_04831 [Plasmodium vivax Brazil I]|uniref:Uncharacterized protein n=1 Tax=Plasmodium vivax (strain Brazil I) TaxID=1033975 RepID=A0A0J9VN92_PLAV1|nr:hypothetical protein PVBG_04831 [Plasmodium vivax Brazil I]
MTIVRFGNTNVCKINTQSSCKDLYTDITDYIEEKALQLKHAENVNAFIIIKKFISESSPKVTLPNGCDVTNLSIFEENNQYCSACNPKESSVKDISEASCSNSDGKHTHHVSTSEDTEKYNLNLKYPHANSKLSYIIFDVNEILHNELYNNISDASNASCGSPEKGEYTFSREIYTIESSNITNAETAEAVSKDILLTKEEPSSEDQKFQEEPSPPTALPVVNPDVTQPSGHESHTRGTFYNKNCVYFFQIISVLNYKYYFYYDTTS